MTININNLDTENITIDTYSMFTGEGFEECELENLRENNSSAEYDDYDWTYNHAEIVKDLAHASIEILEQAIKYTEYAKIITGITYLKSTSPKFYNYTTDSYLMAVTVELKPLNKYIEKNHAEILARASRYDDSVVDGIVSLESMQHAAICHILDNCISEDDYKMSMWELEQETYSNNVIYKLIAK